MDNLGLVEHVKKAKNDGWGYVYGTWGNVCNESLLQQKMKQYPRNVEGYESFIRSHWIGKIVADCVGLIKSYYWNGKYDGNTDVSANVMYNNAKEKGDINSIPDIPGICVHKDGHIGVYIGDRQVIESHGTKYGVIQTPLTGAGTTPWTDWLKCPFIDYVLNNNDNDINNKIEGVLNAMDIKTLQNWLNNNGFTDENGNRLAVDGADGKHTRAAKAKVKELLGYILK